MKVVSLVPDLNFLHLFEISLNGKWVKTKIIPQINYDTVILKNYYFLKHLCPFYQSLFNAVLLCPCEPWLPAGAQGPVAQQSLQYGQQLLVVVLPLWHACCGLCPELCRFTGEPFCSCFSGGSEVQHWVAGSLARVSWSFSLCFHYLSR